MESILPEVKTKALICFERDFVRVKALDSWAEILAEAKCKSSWNHPSSTASHPNHHSLTYL